MPNHYILKQYSVLPGFKTALGYTLVYTALVLIIPLAGLIATTATLPPEAIMKTITDPRVVASLRLSFTTAISATAVNAIFGLLTAWVLARYSFRGKRILDALIDLPFALPTAVAGLALTALYAPTGPAGVVLDKIGIQAAYTPLGITIALVFIGFPFVVRTVQPVFASIEPGVEEASATLGASRLQTILRVLLPGILPALLTGCALSFARGIGEYGSVVFIAGNMPYKTEITPLIIMTKLEQFQYAEATTVALAMLAVSFVMLLTINLLQGRLEQRSARR